MRTLFLAPRIPYPPDRGDRIRSWHLLRFLAERGAVDLACLSDEVATSAQSSTLHSVCRRVAICRTRSPRAWQALKSLALGRSATEGVFNSQKLHRTVKQWTTNEKYDLVFVYCSSMTQYVEALAIQRRNVLIDLVDVDSCKWQAYESQHRGWRSRLFSIEQNRVERLERRAAELSSHLLVTTDDEARSMREIVPDAAISVIGNGVDLDYFGGVGSLSPQSTCIFTGVLDYPPNVQAVCWFVSKVWGQVKERVPDGRFLIVGRHPTQVVRQLALIPGVEVHPDVPDVRPYLKQSRVVVAPLQVARGIQNKVLEGMAARRAVVASSQAALGIGARSGMEIVTVCDTSEWASSLIRLFNDTTLCEQLASAGRRFVETHHAWADVLRPLEYLLPTARYRGSEENVPSLSPHR
jgi:sugar transferase (PEP-CTERM/EpsH1 system associated)